MKISHVAAFSPRQCEASRDHLTFALLFTGTKKICTSTVGAGCGRNKSVHCIPCFVRSEMPKRLNLPDIQATSSLRHFAPHNSEDFGSPSHVSLVNNNYPDKAHRIHHEPNRGKGLGSWAMKRGNKPGNKTNENSPHWRALCRP